MSCDMIRAKMSLDFLISFSPNIQISPSHNKLNTMLKNLHLPKLASAFLAIFVLFLVSFGTIFSDF